MLPKKCRQHVLKSAHCNSWQGHLKSGKTKDRILYRFYWPGIFKDVENYVASCLTCQVTTSLGTTIAPMALTETITEPFDKLIVDLVGPIRPKTKVGYLYILTALCPATKFPEAIPLKQADSQSVVDALLLIFSRVGFPSEIQSDWGSQFTSELTTLFLEKCGIKIIHSSISHPQSNSVKRFHRTLKSVLRAITS